MDPVGESRRERAEQMEKLERNCKMKLVNVLLMASASLCLAGCASSSKVTLLEPVGPAPSEHPTAARDGSLQVYSARVNANIGINAEVFLWNIDYGRNDFLYEPAHTDYVIYTQDGKVFQRVRNSRGMNDETPALVTLPAGTYKIEAEAATDYGECYAVKPGETTTVHLERDWKPPVNAASQHALVRASDGRIIGWRARTLPASAITQTH
jgi:hypothetical protein